MPAIREYYVNDEDYLYDKWSSSNLFDENSYKNNGIDYLSVLEMQSKSDKKLDLFQYEYLPSSEKTNYLAYNLGLINDNDFLNHSGLTAEDYYKALNENTRIENEWNSKSWLDKTMTTIGDLILGTFDGAYSVLENLVDAVLMGVGQKDLAVQDQTGYAGIHSSIEDRYKRNLFLSRTDTGNILYSTFNSMGAMWSLLLNDVVPGLGSGLFYTSIFGGAAREAATSMPDAGYGEIFLYAGLRTGAEYVGEKIFGNKWLGKGVFNTASIKAKNIFFNIALSFIEEGSEEVVTELLDYAIVSGMNAVFSPESDAWNTALRTDDLWKSVWTSFVSGGLMGAISTGIGVAFTDNITLPNGKKLSKNQSYLWKSGQLTENFSSNQISEVYKLKLKLGNDFSTESKEYQNALAKDRETIKSMAKVAQTLDVLKDIVGESKYKNLELTTRDAILDASTAFRNFYLEYSNPNYKNITNNISAENQKSVTDFNAKNEESGIKLTAVNTQSDELKLVSKALEGSGKKVIPVKVGDSNGKVRGELIQDSSSNIIFVDVDKLGRMTIPDIVKSTAAESLVDLLSKNPSIIDDPAIKSLFNKPDGKYSREDKLQIAQALLTDPKTIRSVIGCSKVLAGKLIKFLQQQIKNSATNTEYNKIKYKQLNEAFNRYKLGLVKNASTIEGVSYFAEKYNIDPKVLFETMNKVKTYDIERHYISEKMNINIESENRQAAIDELINERKGDLIEANKDVDDYSVFLDEKIYRPSFVKYIKSMYSNKNFAYCLNSYLFDNYEGIYINSNTGTFESALNLINELNPEFTYELESLLNKLDALRSSKKGEYEDYEKLIEEFNNKNYTVKDMYDPRFIEHIQLKDNADIKLDYSSVGRIGSGGFNPITNTITINIDATTFNKRGIVVDGTNDVNTVRSEIFHTILHESIHVMQNSNNSYIGSNINELAAWFDTEDGKFIAKKIREAMQLKYDYNPTSKNVAQFVYLLTYGELEASRYSKGNKINAKILDDLNFSYKIGTSAMEDGFIAYKNGKVIGKGIFRGIIINLPSFSGMQMKTSEDGIEFFKGVSLDMASPEVINKESSLIEKQNIEEELDLKEELKDLLKKYKSDKSFRTKKNFMRIGELSDLINIDLSEIGYDYDKYDALRKESKKEYTIEKSEKDEYVEEKESDEELNKKADSNFQNRMSSIDKAIENKKYEELSRLERYWTGKNKENLIEEMGEDNYNKLIDYLKKNNAKTRTSLNIKSRNLRNNIEKGKDYLSKESLERFEALNFDRNETAKMSYEELEARLNTLTELKQEMDDNFLKEEMTEAPSVQEEKTKTDFEKIEDKNKDFLKDKKYLPLLQDEKGNNVVFYKGARTKNVTEFDNTKGMKMRAIPGAIWASDSEAVAATYTGSNAGSLYTLTFKDIKNPLYVDAEGRAFAKTNNGLDTESLVLEAKEKGYDAVIIENVVDRGSRYIKNKELNIEASKPHTDVVVFSNNNININNEFDAEYDQITEKKEENKYDFRELQKISREEVRNKSWEERDLLLNEELRERISTTLKRELDSRRNSRSNSFGLLKLKYNDSSYTIYSNVDGKTFHDIFEISREYTKNGELVDLHDVSDYNNCKNYLSEDGTAGFSITSSGDLISVFNLKATIKNGWLHIIKPIVVDNAKTLDCYVSDKQNLQAIYTKVLGFKTASVMEWNSEYDHDNIGENHNNPSVAFMVNTNSEVKTKYFKKDEYDAAYSYQQSFFSSEKSATRAISETSDEQILDQKMEEKSQLDEDLDAWNNERYFEDYETESKSKMFEEDRTSYKTSSYLEFIDYHKNSLARIDASNASEILDAIESGKLKGNSATFVAIYMYQNRYKLDLSKDQLETLVKLSSGKSTAAAQTLANARWAMEEDQPIIGVANEIKDEYGVDVTLPEELVLKAYSRIKGDSIADKLKSVNKEIEELKQKLKTTSDPYELWLREETLKELEKLSELMADNDIIGLLNEEYKRLLSPNYDYTKGKIEAAELSNEIVQELIKQIDGLEKTLTMKKETDKGSLFTKETSAKIRGTVDKIRSFRYLMMLSNFSTYARNYMVNFSVGMSKIMENMAGKRLEKFFLKNAPESQIGYYGDYDEEFSKFIDDTFTKSVDPKLDPGNKWIQTKKGAISKQLDIEKNKFKNQFLRKWQEFEQKMLSDKPFVRRATMKNIKSMISGGKYQIMNDVIGFLEGRYKVKGIDALMEATEKSNPELNERLQKARNNDLIEITKLAKETRSQVLDMILDKARYRAAKLYFGNDNILSRKIAQLRKSHPVIEEALSWIFPFARVAGNTLNFAIEHSPVGFVKAIISSLRSKNTWITEMRNEMDAYIKGQYKNYIKSQKEAIKSETKTFEEWKKTELSENDEINASDEELKKQYKKYKNSVQKDFAKRNFDTWLAQTMGDDFVKANSGDAKAISKCFNKLVNEGKIVGNMIGLDNPFAKADTIELYASATTGTMYFMLGVLLGLTGAFDFDEEDYMGFVFKMGNVKIRLSDLAPFATVFSMGAALTNPNGGTFSKRMRDQLSTFYDQTMLGTVESMFSYNNSMTDILLGQIQSVPQQFLPAFGKSLAKVIDPATKKKTGNFFQKFYYTTLSNIPGLSYLVPNKIDPYTGNAETRFSTGIFGEIVNTFNPLQVRIKKTSAIEDEAIRVGAVTTGASGSFKINDKEYKLVGKELEKYSKLRADYVNTSLTSLIKSSAYKQMNDDEKQAAIKKIYTQASEVVKINYWLDSGHSGYVFTDRSKYYEYNDYISESKKLYFRKKWNGSKFIE